MADYLDTVTQRLHAKAEAEVREKLTAKTAEFKRLLEQTDHGPENYVEFEGGCRVHWSVAFKALSELVVAHLLPRAKDHAVSEFIRSVETSSHEIRKLVGDGQ